MIDNERVLDKNKQKSESVDRTEAIADEAAVDAATADAAATDAATSHRVAEALLVSQAKLDANAFGLLYERYVDRIYAYIYNRIHNVQESEDLTARTFYRALAKIDSYEDRGLPFSAWLYRIAHNLVANHHRDNSRRQFVPFEMINLAGRKQNEPEVVIAREEDHETLWDAIERLPAERRDLLIYKFSNRLSNLEIGELMDKSEGAIKSLYFRTLAALRKDLKGYVWGKEDADETGE